LAHLSTRSASPRTKSTLQYCRSLSLSAEKGRQFGSVQREDDCPNGLSTLVNGWRPHLVDEGSAEPSREEAPCPGQFARENLTSRASAALRLHRASPARWRRSRGLPGGRLRSTGGGRPPPRLGCWHVNRRNQFRNHCRHYSRRARRQTTRVLGAGQPLSLRFRHRFCSPVIRRRCRAQVRATNERRHGYRGRCARLLCAADSGYLASAAEYARGDELLRYDTAQDDARAPRRFRPHKL
jgi:hypothetical protein